MRQNNSPANRPHSPRISRRHPRAHQPASTMRTMPPQENRTRRPRIQTSTITSDRPRRSTSNVMVMDRESRARDARDLRDDGATWAEVGVCLDIRPAAARNLVHPYKPRDSAQERRAYKTRKQSEYETARINRILAEGKKPCNGCGEVKTLAEFEPKPTNRLGYSSHCRVCKNETRMARYYAQLERERQRSKDYYEANGHTRRTAQQTAREQAVEIYGGYCVNCGDTRDLQFDHVNGDGGTHRTVEAAHIMVRRIAATGTRITDHDLQLLCKDCHQRKRPTISHARLAFAMATSRDWPTAV
jgi:hypothetical protein